MSRATVAKARHKKILRRAKGFFGRSKKCFRLAKERVEKGMQYAYRDRKAIKRTRRATWIQRLNAAVRQQGITYSRFIAMYKSYCNINKLIEMNRKMLSELAINSYSTFTQLIQNILSS